MAGMADDAHTHARLKIGSDGRQKGRFRRFLGVLSFKFKINFLTETKLIEN